jgi:hypothetical protein
LCTPANKVNLMVVSTNDMTYSVPTDTATEAK